VTGDFRLSLAYKKVVDKNILSMLFLEDKSISVKFLKEFHII